MAAPFGNQNAVKAKRWQQAIDRALESRSKSDGIAELDRLANIFLDAIEEMTISTDKRGPDVGGFRELADRLDGRAAQQVVLGSDAENPLTLKIVSEDSKL